jgi:hypothetical protein
LQAEAIKEALLCLKEKELIQKAKRQNNDQENY